MNMLRKYIRFYLPALLTALFAVAALSACSDETDFPSGDIDKAGYITLRVKNSKADSRAEVADDDNNENLISSLVLCLYPENNPSGKPAFVKSYTFNTPTQVTIEEKFTTELANTLFPGGATTCHALVVANLPEADVAAISVETSLEDIRKIAISSEFDTKDVQDAFIMDGDASVIRTGANTANDKATGDIPLTRAAARISLAAKLQNITIGEGDEAEVWEPDPRGLRVILNNGVKNSAVNPANHENVAEDYYSTPWSGARTFSRADGAASTDPYTHSVPFYTYPNSWAADGSSENMTYMTLVCPWRKQGEGEAQFRNYYYMVPVLKDGNELVRNVAYQVNISLGVLGSLTPDEPMEILDCSYTAVNWGDLNMDVNIQDSRYLVVDQNSYVMDNVTDISIPYYTSHPSEITDIKITYYRYYVNNQGTETPIEISRSVIDESNRQAGENLCEYKLRTPTAMIANDHIYIKHPLVLWYAISNSSTSTTTQNLTPVTQRNLPTTTVNYYLPTTSSRINQDYRNDSPEPAYSRYEIEVTVQHIGHSEFSQTIKITQYPQMYITADFNTFKSSGTNTAVEGNAFVNKTQSAGGNRNTYWTDMPGFSSGGSNSNPNMYIIHITQLNNDENYIIGDPRATKSDLLGFSGTNNANATNQTLRSYWAYAPGIEGSRGRNLTYYYPTDNSTSKERWIAPIIRTASSFGMCYQMSYEEAQRRCASYQELNCPAGRWRIPTLAEIEYIAKLSEKELIPRLFNVGGYYWSAQGRVQVKDSGEFSVSGTSDSYVRCVYDEWFWGDSKLTPSSTNPTRYTFTWGDRKVE